MPNCATCGHGEFIHGVRGCMHVEDRLECSCITFVAEHGADALLYDNIGQGWRIHCLCGWSSSPWARVARAGVEFDVHLKGAERR